MCLADRRWPCQHCHKPMYLHCDCRDFPQFTPLGGMRMLAQSLMAHYEIDYSAHPEVVAELADVIGEELLSVGRDVLEEHRLMEVANG